MKPRNTRLLIPALLCAFLGTLHAAEVSPEAAKLLDKHIKARGGLAAYRALKIRRTVAAVHIGDKEIKTITLETVPDGKSYQLLEGPSIGKTEVGCDGRRVWQRSASGASVLPDDDPSARAVRRSARAAEFWDYRKDDRTFQYLGKEKLEGAEYEVLQTSFTLQSGDVPAKYYFESGGLLRVIIAGEGAQTRLDFSEYRPVDGVQYPFKIKFSAPPVAMETVVTEIKHNVPFDPAVFEFKGN